VSLAVVAYHYVRPFPDRRFPSLRGRTPKEFRDQLRFLKARYQIIGPETFREAFLKGKGLADLPSKGALLTFDDGYRDHIQYVAPILDELGLKALFFPIAQSVAERKVADANKIQFLLARGTGSLEVHLELPPGPLPKRPFDDEPTARLKWLLHEGLPEAARRKTLDSLFEKFVTKDERALAEELYLSEGELRALFGAGHSLGVHGYSHRRLGRMSSEEAAADIDGCLGFLGKLGVDTRAWIGCYPHGDFTDETLRLVELKGALVAFTTHRAQASASDSALALPRWDTNDLPLLPASHPGSLFVPSLNG
jgi:peptidoglycan/xylan/chitin deacetylase (PgdA/CDA1 family)